jgi:ParB family chromosome partitioning protein
MSTTLIIDTIDTNGNVRHSIDNIKQLAASIREVGLIQPVVVTQSGALYQLIAGHRRLAAVKELGWTEIPAYVIESDAAPKLQQLVENVQREELTPLEEAQALFELKEEGHTNKQVEAATGIKSKAITTKRKLAALTPEAFAVVEDMDEPDQLALAEIAGDPELLDDVIAYATEQGTRWGRPDAWIREVRQQRARDKTWAAIEPKLEKLRNSDVEVLGSREEPGKAPGAWLLIKRGKETYESLDVKAHSSEPCNVIVVGKDYGGEPTISVYCKSQTRHLPNGKSELKFEDAAARAKSKELTAKENKQLKHSKTARRMVLREALPEVVKIKGVPWIKYLSLRLVEEVWREKLTEAAAILELEYDNDKWGDLQEQLKADPTGRRTAAAIILGELVQRGIGGDTAVAEAMLTEAGFPYEERFKAVLKELMDG